MSKRGSIVRRALRRVGRFLAGARAYAGAKVNGLTKDWFTSMLSADQEIKGSLQKLRDRARSLVRDFPYASRFVQACAENIVGPDGIRLQVRVETVGGANAGALKKSLNDEVEAKWREWAEPETCTVDGRLGFVDLEHLIAETLPQDGEVLVRIVRGFPNKFGFALQMLDADQLDTQMERGADGAGDGWVRMGVEMDRWGRPIAYHLWTAHPSEYGRGTRRRERVSADDLIYLGIQRRPGQTRAVTWFHPVLIAERMIAGWEEASITAARAGALTPWWIKAPDPDKVAEDAQIPVDFSLELSSDVQGQVLPPGYDVTTFDPKYPNAEFDPFRNALLQSVAIGLRVSHLTLTGDTRQANFSSMRAGQLPEREAWKLLARWLTRHFHARVYREWVKAAVLAGALEVPPREMERVLAAATWQCRGWPWVQPMEDIQAAERELRLGLTTLTILAAERGRDFAELVAQRAEEMRLAKEAGVDVSGTEGKVAAPAKDEEQQPTKKPAGAADDDAEAERAALEERVTRARAVAEAATQTAESLTKVIDRQAHALAAAAVKPIPPAEVTIGEGAIRVEVPVTVEAPKPTRRSVNLVKTEDGRTVGEVVEEPVVETAE